MAEIPHTNKYSNLIIMILRMNMENDFIWSKIKSLVADTVEINQNSLNKLDFQIKISVIAVRMWKLLFRRKTIYNL